MPSATTTTTTPSRPSLVLHLLLLLLLSLVPSSSSSSSSSSSPTGLCLHHLGCYQDEHLLLQHAATFHSYDTHRTAENCARLCLQRRPSTQLVLVKLEGVDQLLSCSCGDDLTLGNHTGLTLDHWACNLCPDSLREKCGSDVTSSVFSIDRTGVEPCGNRLLHVPPPVILPSTQETEEVTPTEPIPPEPAPVQSYNTDMANSTPSNNVTHEFAENGTLTSLATTPHLRYLGCFDEDDVNETLVVTMVVKDGGYGDDDGGDGDDGGGSDGGGGGGVRYCAGNCSAAHPAHAEVVLMKVLSADLLYCGCGKRAALPPDGGGDERCSLRCGEGLTASLLPCGGFTAVSAYERSGAGGRWAGAWLVWAAVCLFRFSLSV